MNNAAAVHRDLGHAQQSVDMLQAVLVARRDLGVRYGEALTLQNLVGGLGLMGDLAAGRKPCARR